MADDRQVTINIKSTYDGKGEVDAKKGLKSVEAQAKQTGKAAQEAGQQGESGFNSMAMGVGKVIAAVAAAKGVLDFFTSSIAAANKNARSVNMLSAAYQNVGYTAAGALDQAKKFASEMQRLTGIADEAFLDAQRLLANYGVVGAKAQESIRAAYALSTAQGMSFETALMQIAKAAAGSTSALSRYGIVLADGVKEGEKFDAVLKQINDRFGASAQATLGDMTTQVNALKEEWGDFKEQIGNSLIPTFRKLIDVAREAVGFMQFLGGNNGKTAFSEAMEETNKQIAKIKQEIKEYQDVRAGAPAMVDKEIAKLEKQLKVLEGRKKILLDGNNEYQRSLYEQKKAAQEQEKQIEATRIAQAAKKQKTDEEKEAQKEITKELERQNKILNNAGVGPKQTTSGWDTSSYVSEKPMDMASMLTGSDLNDTANFLQTIEEQKAGLEDLYNKKLELLEQGNLDEETFAEARLELDRQYGAQRAALDDQLAKRRQTTMASALNNLVSLQNSSNKKMAEVGKAAAIAQSTIDTYKAANAAYSAMAGIPVVGPALGAAAAAAAIVAGLNNVAQISGIKLADGGLVKAVTGGVPAIVGEGGSDEAVLPLDNARAMERIGDAIAEQSGAVGGVTLTQNITIQAGESLIPDITEALRNATVDALEMANLTVKVGNSQQGYSV